MNRFFTVLILSLSMLWACEHEADSYYQVVGIDDTEYAIHNGDTFEVMFDVFSSRFRGDSKDIRVVSVSSNTSVSTDDENLTTELAVDDDLFHDDFEVVRVDPVIVDGNAQVHGKWVATIREKSGRDHISISTVRLAVDYRDVNNIKKSMFSGDIKIKSVPTLTQDNIDLRTPERLSYFVPNNERPLNPALAYVAHSDMMLEGEAFGVERFKSVTAELLDNGNQNRFAIEIPENGRKYSLCVIPVATEFSSLDISDFPVEAKLRFAIEDIAGSIITLERSILFFPGDVTIPATESGLVLSYDFFEATVPMKNYLAKAGVTKEYLQNLPGNVSLSLAYDTEYPNGDKSVFGLSFEDNIYDGDIMDMDNFKMDFVNLGVDPGTYYGILTVVTTDASTIRPLIATQVRMEIRIDRP